MQEIRSDVSETRTDIMNEAKRIKHLAEEAENEKHKILTIADEITQLKSQMSDYFQTAKENNSEIETAHEQAELSLHSIKKAEAATTDILKAVETLHDEAETKNNEIAELKTLAADKLSEIEDIKKEIEGLKEEIKKYYNGAVELNRKTDNINLVATELNAKANDLLAEISQTEKNSTKLSAEINSHYNKIQTYEAYIEEVKGKADWTFEKIVDYKQETESYLKEIQDIKSDAIGAKEDVYNYRETAKEIIRSMRS